MDAILLKVYEEAHQHLRATDSKRDQIIGFYIAFLGFLLSTSDKIVGVLPEQVILFLLGILTILGIVVGGVVNQLRFWHTVYVNTAIVIQNLVFHKSQLSEEKIKETWEAYQTSIKSIKKKWSLGTEDLTLIGFLIVALLPLSLLLYYLLENTLWLMVVSIHLINVFVVSIPSPITD